MNRIGGALLATTAVIGIVAGGYAGVTIGEPGDDDQAQTPPAAGRSPGDDGRSASRLFYATPDAIHDGEKTVPLTELGLNEKERVVSLERLPDAWLLVILSPGQGGTHKAVRVEEGGTIKMLGAFRGVWDLSDAGDLIVAHEVRSETYSVRSTADGSLVDSIEASDLNEEWAVGGAAFSATGVVTEWASRTTGRSRLYETELGTWRSDPAGTDFGYWSTNPGGLYLVGEKTKFVGNRSVATCLQAGPVGDRTGWWEDCSLRHTSELGPQFSRDGTWVLGEPADGPAPPREYFAVRVADNEQIPVAAPNKVRAAEWLDDDHFVVATEGRARPFLIWLCPVDTGVCEKYDEVEAESLLLGRAEDR